MTRLGEIIEMDDGSLCPVWCNGTPAPGTVLFAEQKFLEADVFRAVQAAKKNAETSVSEAEYTLLMGRLSGRDFDLIQRAIDAALASQAAQGRSVAYWAAVDSDGTPQMTMSADDGNGGLAARQEVNDWINEAIAEDGVPLRLIALYTAPPAPAVRDDVEKDAERFRWLTDDHASPDVRVTRRSICISIPTRSLSGARLDIDAAMLAATPEVPRG